MPDFTDITVVAVYGDGRGADAVASIKKSSAALPGSRTLLITDRRVDTDVPQAILPDGLDYAGYSHFVVYRLHDFIETDFALIVQHDGWALNPANWRESWFEYDYIGGLTHAGLARDGRFYTNYRYLGQDAPLIVQNGGFSLRSKKFLRAPAEHGIRMKAMPDRMLNNEDVQLCCYMRPALEAAGLRFAGDEEARLFAFEHLNPSVHGGLDLRRIFGHHSRARSLVGPNKMSWHLTKEQTGRVMWEDKVYELFQSYGYEICMPGQADGLPSAG